MDHRLCTDSRKGEEDWIIELQKISNKKQLIRIKEYVDKFLDSYGSNSFNVSLETIQNESFCMNEKQELYIIMNENGEEVGFF